MKNKDLANLPAEDRQIEIDRRARRRTFLALVFLDVILFGYIIYSIIRIASKA